MSVNCDVYSKMELCRSLSSISKLLRRVLELTEFCCSFLQVDRAEIRAHLRDTNNHDPDGNAWCHLDGCRGTYTAYRINIWGLQATTANRRAGKDKVAQQVVNLENHLSKAHGTSKFCVCVCVCVCVLVSFPAPPFNPPRRKGGGSGNYSTKFLYLPVLGLSTTN